MNNKPKRIAAIVGVVLLLSMYVVSIISAVFATENSHGLFMASVFCTVMIPIMIYGFITVYKMVHRKDEEPKEPTSPDKSDKENN
jgi:Na+/proline symporter